MKDKWTQQFQGKLDGYEMAAPEMEWTELDKALADNALADNALAKNKRPSMALVWGRRLAAAAAVALMVIGGARVLLPELEGGRDEAPEQNSGERWLSQRHDITAGHEEKTAGHGENTAGHEKGLLAMAEAANIQSTTAVTANIQSTTAVTDDNNINNKDVNGGIRASRSGDYQKSTSKKDDNLRSKKEDNLRSKKDDIFRSEKYNHRTKYHGGELMAAVYMQNAMTANGNMGGMTGMMNSTSVSNSPYGMVSDEFRVGSLDFLAESNPRDVRYDHSRPIKVGLSVKYNIDNHWSLSSGLTYSYLRSSFDYSEGKAFGIGVQKLHYVGLPLAASYNVVSAKKLKVYLTAGGEMQKLVSGKATMDGVNIPEEDKKHDVKEGGMQWSLNAAIGAEYNFVDNFGIYIEPGVSHYIDNHSSVENFYKHKPTNFSLNVGLRLSIR